MPVFGAQREGNRSQAAGYLWQTTHWRRTTMDCRTFRKKHVAFVDGVMNARAEAVMFEHVEACARCARLDVVVRRGLLVARNLPQIRPSQDFMVRLDARLKSSEGILDHAAHGARAVAGTAWQLVAPTRVRTRVPNAGLQRVSFSP